METEHKRYLRAWASIDLDRICANIERTRQRIKPGTSIMAIIKADGYGHGAVPVARVLDSGVDAYGVAMLEEALELRRDGVKKPILILGNTPFPQFSELVEYDVRASVFYKEMAAGIAGEAMRQKKTASIHLKLDTGMSRIGFALSEESIKEIIEISRMDGIRIEGCFTHFAKADEKNKEFTLRQLKLFMDFANRLKEEGVKIPILHISNSAGMIDVPQANLDMVRSGISTYGIYPSQKVEKENLFLEPAMSIRARISFIKTLPANTPVSYGGTFVTEKETKVATIPVGYGDGYQRALSNRGWVLVKGKKAPILGRICMDQFMVDVTGIPDVGMNDVATLLGQDGDQIISLEQLSEMAGSFPYEFLCDVGKRIPRVYYYQGRKVGTLDYTCCSGAYDLSFPGNYR